MEGGDAEGVCVVTGGRGFAARHLVEMLLRSPKWSLVRIADLVHLSASIWQRRGALSAERVACQGADAVFHMAAPDSSINNFKLHYSVNVEGTKNIIHACIECKVKRLIYTSSPSVVFDGIHGIYNADESMSNPDKAYKQTLKMSLLQYNDSYSETKAAAESLVIKANGVNGLLTCCIRRSSIFGPGDKLLVPSLVTTARAGKSKFIVGDGNNMYDFTYVENVAHGHICAEQALALGGAVAERAAGQAYFITNMEPIKFWEFMSRILEGLGYQRPNVSKLKNKLFQILVVRGQKESESADHRPWGFTFLKNPGDDNFGPASSHTLSNPLIIEYCRPCETACSSNWLMEAISAVVAPAIISSTSLSLRRKL
ncbi:3beta-hydroxysteroid-dehydrogenase/decarboxylase isoform 2 [Acorus calamus]|uniref:3beta-hydroxysteroid-dehydrogenase/decarboxylase isoform 2 n=1 Tax=Acorus calamus TaxID=4465 RepID=A0AAV9EJI0_ACOCL|nr:3beta-hydroxysteroid-dehydrogenase/decarboxylase isoform 2 [Acorus calamus]